MKEYGQRKNVLLLLAGSRGHIITLDEISEKKREKVWLKEWLVKRDISGTYNLIMAEIAVEKSYHKPQYYKDLTRRNTVFKGWSWFKFNNLGLARGMALKVYTSVVKGFKLKVRKFWGLLPTFVEVTREKLVVGFFAPPERS